MVSNGPCTDLCGSETKLEDIEDISRDTKSTVSMKYPLQPYLEALPAWAGVQCLMSHAVEFLV